MSTQVTSSKIGLLPPRKRAKTDEEKEQRRVERILRNRRAAHASREKKRRHVEVLENYVKSLESNITDYSNLSDKFFSFVDKLNQSGIDLNGLGLASDLKNLKRVKPVERPNGLDITTTQTFKKKKASNKSGNSSRNEDEFGSDDDMYDEEDEEDEEQHQHQHQQQQHQEEEQVVLKHKSSALASETTVKLEPKEENFYLSPPNSTSPSRLRLSDEESMILNNDYSNLFDDEDPVDQHVVASSAHIVTFDNCQLVDGSDKTTNTAPYIKLEEEEMKFSDLSYVDAYQPSSMDVLCEYNSVHHPAVMMIYL